MDPLLTLFVYLCVVYVLYCMTIIYPYYTACYYNYNYNYVGLILKLFNTYRNIDYNHGD